MTDKKTEDSKEIKRLHAYLSGRAAAQIERGQFVYKMRCGMLLPADTECESKGIWHDCGNCIGPTKVEAFVIVSEEGESK